MTHVRFHQHCAADDGFIVAPSNFTVAERTEAKSRSLELLEILPTSSSKPHHGLDAGDAPNLFLGFPTHELVPAGTARPEARVDVPMLDMMDVFPGKQDLH